jgi:hypothetical protein
MMGPAHHLPVMFDLPGVLADEIFAELRDRRGARLEVTPSTRFAYAGNVFVRFDPHEKEAIDEQWNDLGNDHAACSSMSIDEMSRKDGRYRPCAIAWLPDKPTRTAGSRPPAS